MNATETLKESETRTTRPTLSSLLANSSLGSQDEVPPTDNELTHTATPAQARGQQGNSKRKSSTVGASSAAALDAKERKEREPRLQPMARKLAETAHLLVQLAQREDAKRLAEHHRVRAICNTIFGTGLTHLLRDSPLLTPSDKDFLKQLGYL